MSEADQVASWWVKGGLRWISLLEELSRAGIALDRVRLAEFATRLALLQGIQGDDMQEKLLAQLATLNTRHQLQAELNQVRVDYDKSLALLASLKAGETDLDEVQLTPDGWQLVEATSLGPTEMEPETAAPCGGQQPD